MEEKPLEALQWRHCLLPFGKSDLGFEKKSLLQTEVHKDVILTKTELFSLKLSH